MEEQLARVEIHRTPNGGYSAVLWTETEGDKEITARSLDALFRELTMDLDFAVGASARDGRGVEVSAEEEFENLQYAQEWEQ
ncbi:MAG: hypothetical protein QOJ26_387 [Thermoplasmata archaeon]|jgi:hypothetical protein|nr:hypothetical protein [Thermoplasmata archaeon]MEA3165530.1 hypothetical protein [Thermoplasmata archaeon]